MISNVRGVFAAEGGGDGVDAETALACEPFGFRDLREGREHQKIALGAGVEVGTAGLEVWAETAWDDCDQGKSGFANGASDSLFARRNASRNDYTAAIAEEKGLVGFRRDFGGCGAARDLDEQFVWNFCKKAVSDGVAGGGERGDVGSGRALSERAADEFMKVDRAGNLEEIGVLHDGPTTFCVAQYIAGHALQLAFAEEDCVVEPRKPEGRRSVDCDRGFECKVGLRAGDLETSDDFAEWCAKSLVNPDDTVKMFGHYRVLAGFDFGKDLADLFPGLGDGGAERRWNELAVYNFAENGAATFHDQRDHVKPRFAIIPAWQSYAGFEVAVFVAFAIQCRFSFHYFCAQGAQGVTPGCARRALEILTVVF